MNILFVGSTSGTSTSLHYFTSLVRLGHAVLPWNPDYFRADRSMDRWIQKVNRGPTPWKVRRINEALIQLCRDNHFDLVFVVGENYLSREALDSIRSHGSPAPKFLFHSHDNVFADGILKPADFFQNLASFDIAFTTKSQNVVRYERIGQLNSHFIPSAYEPSVHRPIPVGQSRLGLEIPVSFIGTYDASRIRWLDGAGWDRTEVWGNGWKKSPSYWKYRKRIHSSAVYYHQFADICSRSRCCLGLLREEVEDRHTQRTFEIPACGGLQFAPRTEEIQGFFEDKREIVLFETPEELSEKLDYYLAHETESRNIAMAGHQRCLQGNHRYVDRVEKMLKLAER